MRIGKYKIIWFTGLPGQKKFRPFILNDDNIITSEQDIAQEFADDERFTIDIKDK